MIKFNKLICAGAVIVSLGAVAGPGGAVKTSGGNAVAVVLPAGERTRFEKTAKDELCRYLAKVTGKNVAAFGEGDFAGGRAIYVGRTRFAAASGIDLRKFKEEEWCVKEVGGSLVVAGGDIGTLYAAYRFLEDAVGVHWLDPTESGEHVPSRGEVDWTGIDLRGCPKLRYRHAYLVPGESGSRFLARNRATTGRGVYGGSGESHTIYTTMGNADEIRRLFKEHPDWFPLIDGRRYCHLENAAGAAQSQLCFTNPELFAHWTAKMREWIVKDREAAAKAGRKPPMYYAIDQNDCFDGFCRCEACAAIAAREGSNAGILLDFANRVATALAPEFPDVRFQMMALHSTEKPPSAMEAAPNVTIRLCDTTSNVLLPWTDKENAKHLDNLKEWTRHASAIGMWDYSITYGSPLCVNYPTPAEYTFAADIRMLRDCKGEGIFFEHEEPVAADMRDLKVWVEFKLAEDPDLDGDALIRTFTDLYYGEQAGAAIRKYRLMLREKALAAKSRITWFPVLSDYTFIDLDAFASAYALYAEAMAAVRGDAVRSARVEHAFLSLDRLYAIRSPTILRQAAEKKLAGAALPSQRTVMDRYRRVFMHEMNRRGYGEKISLKAKNVDHFLKSVAARRDLPVPEIFKDAPKNSVFMYATTLASVYHRGTSFVDDPSSPAGRVLAIDVGRARREPKVSKLYSWPLPCALWPSMDGTLRGNISVAAATSGDGYRWYKCLGDVKLTQKSVLRIVDGWILPLEGALSDNSELGQKYDIWASVKLDGAPATLAEGPLPDSCVVRIDQIAVVRKTQNSQDR